MLIRTFGFVSRELCTFINVHTESFKNVYAYRLASVCPCYYCPKFQDSVSLSQSPHFFYS